MIKNNLDLLASALEQSKYTVALCGSGCLKECGANSLKSQEVAYRIESKYGDSPEYLYTSAYFSSRPKKFFEFYKNEILGVHLTPTKTAYALAEMEREGKLQCIITGNIFNLAVLGGCRHVINLHGSIHDNYCTHCGHNHSADYIRQSDSIPLCEKCGHYIRPGVSFFGDMVDNSLLTKSIEEVTKADLLLLLGTTLRSEVFHGYLEHFQGKNLIVIHEEEDVADKFADIIIYDQPQHVLEKLGYVKPKNSQTSL